MAVSKLPAKAAKLSLDGVDISITKYENSHEVKLADGQASDNYDATTDLLWPYKLPVSGDAKISVEGYWDLNSTNADILAKYACAAPTNPATVVLTAKSGVTVGSGKFWVSNFKSTWEPNSQNMAPISFDLELTHGVFTAGA